jgi:hypothetical protein
VFHRAVEPQSKAEAESDRCPSPRVMLRAVVGHGDKASFETKAAIAFEDSELKASRHAEAQRGESNMSVANWLTT